MTIGRHLAKRTGARPGVWLALLAAGMQSVLPFLLLLEIARASPSFDDSMAFCSAMQMDEAPAPGDPVDRHTPPGGCPICQALSSAHVFVAPAAVATAFPPVREPVSRTAQSWRRPVSVAAAPYRSRAPPSNI
jgi:hypothetical protein